MNSQSFKVFEKEKSICQRLGVPLPILHPQERIRLLMSFRNEWKLYQRKCDATGENILSAYHPDSAFTVYKNDIWWGDTWNALDYGRDFDFNKGFFEQFKKLQKVVPREGTSVFNSENCEYNSHIRQSKNCYLNSLVAKCEDAYYCYWIVGNKDTYDCVLTNYSSLCYGCIDSSNCYECFVVQESTNCMGCLFSYQLRGCQYCIFSSNLVNKSYYIFNKPTTKDEYILMKNKILNGSYKTWQKACEEFLKMCNKTIHRNLHILQCENVLGDHVYNSRNCANIFDSLDSEDCYNSISAAESKDISSCYSAGWPGEELAYFSVVTRGCHEIAFCYYTWFSHNMYYCDSCVSCSNCFGCVGLHHKNYCILNKQYPKEEYERLVPRIIKHMQSTSQFGEFFPPFCSTFGYNETAAQDFFPLSKEEAVKLGFNWSDYEPPKPKISKVIKASELPDNFRDISEEEILDTDEAKGRVRASGSCGSHAASLLTIECEVSKKPFRIIKPEFQFYKENNLPLPRRAPYQRHLDRMALRNKNYLWDRNCDKCGKIMKTSFSPENKLTIYCEQCYLEILI